MTPNMLHMQQRLLRILNGKWHKLEIEIIALNKGRKALAGQTEPRKILKEKIDHLKSVQNEYSNLIDIIDNFDGVS